METQDLNKLKVISAFKLALKNVKQPQLAVTKILLLAAVTVTKILLPVAVTVTKILLLI